MPISARNLITLAVWGILALLVVVVLYLAIAYTLFGAGSQEHGEDVQKVHVVKTK